MFRASGRRGRGHSGSIRSSMTGRGWRFWRAGYVLCEKTFAGRTPRTEYRLSAAGRRAFEKYLDHMDALIKATRKR
jgi:hypothetical protein